jgi:hypothetical protein
VSLIRGGSSFDGVADFTDRGEAQDDAFGSALAVGDLFPQAPVQQILIGAPLADVDGVSSGALYMSALPPAVAVEAGQIELEMGGRPLHDAQYLDPATRLQARFRTGALIALERSRAQLDDVPCALIDKNEPAVVEIALPAEIEDGIHRLRVTLAAVEGEATIERDVVTYRRFELLGARLGPSPTRGPVEAVFVMTRPGTFEVDVFDAAGRLVAGIGPSAGTAGENRFELPELSGQKSGIYFYRIEATYAGRTVSSRGRIAVVH